MSTDQSYDDISFSSCNSVNSYPKYNGSKKLQKTENTLRTDSSIQLNPTGESQLALRDLRVKEVAKRQDYRLNLQLYYIRLRYKNKKEEKFIEDEDMETYEMLYAHRLL
jgi:hypothetical protein